MGDALREKAFDAAFSIAGDVGEAEDCATEAIARAERRWGTVRHLPDREAWIVREAANLAMAKTSRPGPRRRLVALGTAVAVLLLVASGVAVAGNGGGSTPVVRAAADPATTPAPAATTTSTEAITAATTTTSVVIASPTTSAPPSVVGARSASAVVPAARTTTTTSAQLANKGGQPRATLTELSPANADPGLVYVSAGAVDADGYTSRLLIKWGDGLATQFDYSLSSCHTGDAQAVNASHTYATPGQYTVQLTVTSVACDGNGGNPQSASTTTLVSYSPPPSG